MIALDKYGEVLAVGDYVQVSGRGGYVYEIIAIRNDGSSENPLIVGEVKRAFSGRLYHRVKNSKVRITDRVHFFTKIKTELVLKEIKVFSDALSSLEFMYQHLLQQTEFKVENASSTLECDPEIR